MDGYMYMQSLEDMEGREVKKQELIDRINRVPQPPIEAACKGTALNEIVDSIISAREVKGMTAHKNAGLWYANIEEFSFCYSEDIVNTIVGEVYDCIPQVYTQAEIHIPQGVVTLYGYADYVRDSEVIDLKTTSNYEVGKFRDNWQHVVYPYCLVSSRKLEKVDSFTYLVAELSKGRDGVLRADFCAEEYVFDMKTEEERLRNFLTYEMIPFIEDNRHLITNQKIFR